MRSLKLGARQTFSRGKCCRLEALWANLRKTKVWIICCEHFSFYDALDKIKCYQAQIT